MAEMSLLFSFPDDSDSFVHGFEAGMMWQRMQAGETPIVTDMPVHIANRTALERMARAGGYLMSVVDLMPDETWMHVEFQKLRFGLSVIEGGKGGPAEDAD